MRVVLVVGMVMPVLLLILVEMDMVVGRSHG